MRSQLRRCSGPTGTASLSSAAPGNLIRFLADDGAQHWGELLEGEPQQLPRARLLNVRPGAAVAEPASSSAGAETHLSVRQLLAPLPVDPPPAVVIIGLNYRSHAEETGQPLPRFPVFAYKNPASVVGPGLPICIPPCAREKPEVDFEAELAVVIGSRIRDASADEALDAVLGVTAANDVSARRWQGKKGGGQWSRSKSFDTFCPLGPSILPLGTGSSAARSALQQGGSGLRIRSWVNGKVMQDGNTSDMVFSIGELLSYLSQGTTMLPGTIVLTGTPPGVGYVRSPPVYLAASDRVDVELEGAGVLSNPVENAP